MKKVRINKFVIALSVVTILLTACQSNAAPTVDLQSQAMTAAVATLTAMPTSTQAVPTATATVAPTATVTVAPTAALVAVGPTNFPENINPLTGLPVADPSILNRRPIMIKVSNFPRAGRPLAGLSNADIVFDYFIGEGTNRFLAIFYGENAEKVGPIRSGRLVDAQLVPMYQGILGYSGAWYQIDNTIRSVLGNRAIIDSASTCPALCTDGTVIGVFANTTEMTQYAQNNGIDNTKPNLDGMYFDPAAPTGGVAGQTLNIQYNNANYSEWRYDAASGKYLRWAEDTDANSNLILTESTDRNTGEQMSFTNVVVMFANYIKYTEVMHDISIATNTTGLRAVIFRDGQAYEGTWKSVGTDKPIQFFTTDGQSFPFKPGETWINVMSSYTNMQQAGDGSWSVTFVAP